MTFFAYIIKSLKDGTYYIGSTQDLSARLERHNQGRSKYTKSRKPWELVHYEEHPDRSTAMKREGHIKGRKSRDLLNPLSERPVNHDGKVVPSQVTGSSPPFFRMLFSS